MIRSRKMLSCLLAILLRAASGHSYPSASPAATLHGVVASEITSQRIPHATIWLCDEGGGRLQDAIANDSGEFAFVGLNTGAILLKVSAEGYEPAEIHVEINFGNERGLTVFLKPSKAKLKTSPNAALISAHELSLPKSARKLSDAGKKKLYFENNPTGALQDFQAAVTNAPDYYEAYFQIAMAYLALQKPVDAEKNLEKSVELSQRNFADADIALATIWLNSHDSGRGEPLLRRGLELNPNSWKGHFELGKLELYRNHLDQALQASEKARVLGPEQAVVYRLLSLIHLRQKNYSAAIADLDDYIQRDPDSPEAMTARKIRWDTEQLLEKSKPAATVTAKSPNP